MTFSKNKNQRIKRNLGNIEFIACKDEIISLFGAGYDFKKIFEALGDKKITMSYRTFCLYLRKLFKKEKSKSKISTESAKSLVVVPPQNTKIINTNESKKFRSIHDISDDEAL